MPLVGRLERVRSPSNAAYFDADALMAKNEQRQYIRLAKFRHCTGETVRALNDNQKISPRQVNIASERRKKQSHFFSSRSPMCNCLVIFVSFAALRNGVMFCNRSAARAARRRWNGRTMGRRRQTSADSGNLIGGVGKRRIKITADVRWGREATVYQYSIAMATY